MLLQRGRSDLSGGGVGTIDFTIDYELWNEGAGIAEFGFGVEFFVLGVPFRFNIASVSYGVFRTDGYNGSMDFSKTQNKDKFPPKGQKSLLRAYDDGDSITEIYGEIGGDRANSVMTKDSMQPHSGGAQAAYSNVIARKLLEGAAGTTEPLLIPIKGGDAALYLRLDDDASRGDKDYSSIAYSIIDYNGNETGPYYLEYDGTLDSDLSACEIGGGKVLAVWSDKTKVIGDDEIEIGESLNETDLSYCIFSADGEPDEIKKLTNAKGAERMPDIAYDQKTGRTIISYLSADYQTEGVTLSEDNLENFGNFLYNSYSTICFKVLDENGDVVADYTPAESNYAEYEAANGSLGGMRYLNTQIADETVRSTIDEISLAARNGKFYAVYSLDMDSNVTTDADRELFVTVVDLTTMEQSEPERLTDNAVVDRNPQIADYNDTLQLYWNHGGVIKMVDLEEYAGYKAGDEAEFIKEIANCAATIEAASNAAHSFHVKKFSDGRLALVWQGPKTENGASRNALFYKEYDPQFKRTDFDDEGNAYDVYGSWGNTQTVTVLGENESCTEFSFLDNGERSMICYNVRIADGGGNIASHDAHLLVLEEATTVDVKTSFAPKYPKAGDNVTLDVKLKNTGSLPSEKLTVQIDLVDKDGTVTPIEDKVLEAHYQTDGEVTLSYNLEVPENFADSLIRVVAWENDLQKSAKIERVKFPCASVIGIENAKLTRCGSGYALAFDVKNEGNKDFDGTVGLDCVAESLGVFGDNETFTPVTEDAPISVAAKSSERKVVFFDVAEDKLSAQDGRCELMLTVRNGEDKTVASKTLYVQKNTTSEIPEVKSVWFGSSENVPLLRLNKDDEASLNAQIMPYNARGGYHLEYKSSNPSVATVDSAGNVKAIKGGSANITVSAVKDQAAMVVGADHISNIAANEYGVVDIATSAKQVVMTKTVSVSVAGSASQSTAATVTVPVSGDKETLNVKVEVKNDTATVKEADVDKVLNAEEVGTVTIDVSGLKKDVSEVVIPGAMVDKIADAVADEKKDADGMEVKLPTGTVTFDAAAVATVAEQADGKDVTFHLDDVKVTELTAAQQETVKEMDAEVILDAYLTSDGKRISDFKGGSATVKVPHTLKNGQTAQGITVWYVAGDGTRTQVPATYDGKNVVFTVPHFSNYVIAYDAEKAACPMNAFSDLDPTLWYHDGVHFCLENGMMNGIGNGKFNPNGTTSRAMIVTILYRLETARRSPQRIRSPMWRMASGIPML